MAGPSADPPERVATLHVPGQPLAVFDIGFVNAEGIYALADRSNASLDFFDAASDKYLGRAGGFTGFSKATGTKLAGPNGVVPVGTHEFWASDGDSSVKVVDARTMKVLASIATHGQKRTDEIAYDPRDHLVIAVNNADSPPFVTFISTRTRKIIGRLELPHATDGAEQPLYDPITKLVYLSIPVVDNVDANGAVAVISPSSHKLIKMLPVQKCMPAGLALGPHDNLLLGCSDDGVDAGFPAHSVVMNARSGKILADVPVGGSDEVWSDMRHGRYYAAAVANKGGPALGVIDSLDNHMIAAIPTGPRAHSVAADEKTGKIFVPIQADTSVPDCAQGCIAVFAPKGQ
ncbi:MAG: WD40 repeat domain-containing protein [Gammaproteobacteria bacterium]|nr:WD40 repeat domain-containing protein [Gammaproteobacteria bacterium]